MVQQIWYQGKSHGAEREDLKKIENAKGPAFGIKIRKKFKKPQFV
jgi:hypothetical protein